MLFREMIAVYSNNHSKYQNSFCGQSTNFLVVEIDGVYSNRNYCALKLYILFIKGTFWTVLKRSLRNKGKRNIVWGERRPPACPRRMFSE